MDRHEAEDTARDNFMRDRLAEADRMMDRAKQLIASGTEEDIRRGYEMREAARLLYRHTH